MDIKTKLTKLESALSRYLIFTAFLIWSVFQGITAYDKYNTLFITNGSIGAEGYLTLTYLWSANVLLCITGLVFFGLMNFTVKNKERYLHINDEEIIIPNALSNKVKKVLITDIENISLEGFFQDRIKIKVKTNEYFSLPRIYNCYEIELEELYRKINEQLVELQKKDN